jgi:hypothetical protein
MQKIRSWEAKISLSRQELLELYGTRKFIAVFTRARNKSSRWYSSFELSRGITLIKFRVLQNVIEDLNWTNGKLNYLLSALIA